MIMSKPEPIFNVTPVKSIRSSPASSLKPNRSGSKTDLRPGTPTRAVTGSSPSPRKCRLQTEVQSSATQLRVKSRFQYNVGSPAKPSPRAASASTSSRVVSNGQPVGVNVKTMKSCFEPQKGKGESRPPPSRPPPSPSARRPPTSQPPSPASCRSKPLAASAPATPRQAGTSAVGGVKSILSSRSRYAAGSPPPPRPPTMRRSVSTGCLPGGGVAAAAAAAPLQRSSSQCLTPRPRVTFQDEAAAPNCFSPVLLDHTASDNSSLATSTRGERSNLTVAVRLRPLFHGETCAVVTDEPGVVRVREHTFAYNECFGPDVGQADVFALLAEPLLRDALCGYNVCLFAYGQTGSGKTHSMMGGETEAAAGVIPRFSSRLFQALDEDDKLKHTKVEISYFEIYNEKIHDLLGPEGDGGGGGGGVGRGRGRPLRVREHPELGPYVVDLTVHTAHRLHTLQDWLRVGNSRKATAATEMNVNSSRAHAIFTITLTRPQAQDCPGLCNKINLVDLAGSERLAQTCATGDRLKEGVSINRSLLTLGKVISSLAEGGGGGGSSFVPYRESVLTWLLRESLGGNSRTAMLATVSASRANVDETLSTLRYAAVARHVVNTARVNETTAERRLRELMEENRRLREELQIGGGGVGGGDGQQQVAHLTARLKDALQRNVAYEEQVVDLRREVDELSGRNRDVEESTGRTERQLEESERTNERLRDALDEENERNRHNAQTCQRLGRQVDEARRDNERLATELADTRARCDAYKRDISQMKDSLREMERNSSHKHCDSQVQMLRSTLSEAERTMVELRKRPSSHVGCEQEISTLREMIGRLKADGQRGEHDIEQLAEEMGEREEERAREREEFGERRRELQDQLDRLREEHRRCADTRQEVTRLEEALKLVAAERASLERRLEEREADARAARLEYNRLKRADGGAGGQIEALTKQLLDAKSQLREAVRAKEMSDRLSSQLQELKLAASCSPTTPTQGQTRDDKENSSGGGGWETPGKVVRRSIARSRQVSEGGGAGGGRRCSLVVHAEEVHQALEDAQEICVRLNIPYVFQPEPEVTTRSWFDVNVRVWDQRTAKSVRWSREAFLAWLTDMKRDIFSRSRGQKMFESSPWLQRGRGAATPTPTPTSADGGGCGDARRELQRARVRLVSLECALARQTADADPGLQLVRTFIVDIKAALARIDDALPPPPPPLRAKNQLA